MLNVLLVDDSTVIRKMLRRALGDATLGISEIFEAGDGSQALSLLATTQVHLILCDVNMPVMGGLELIRGLRKNPKSDANRLPAAYRSNSASVFVRPRMTAIAIFATLENGGFLRF